MTPEQLRQAGIELCRRTRAAQGLPPHVTDPAVLDRLAVLVRPTTAGEGVAANRACGETRSGATPDLADRGAA